MQHVCNPWCFDGIHAHLFDSEASERAVLDTVAPRLAQSMGLQFVGYSEVRAQGAPAPGTPTAKGLARGRFVIWGR